MNTGQIIILSAYVLGQIIVGCFLKKKIKTLRTQVNSQSQILENVERYMNIQKVEDVEQYVDLIRKKTVLEKEEALKKIESEKTRGFEAFLTEAYELYRVLSLLIIGYADYWYFEMVIKNMNKTTMKEVLLNELEKQKETYKKSKDYPRTKLLREAILMRLHEDKKLTF